MEGTDLLKDGEGPFDVITAEAAVDHVHFAVVHIWRWLAWVIGVHDLSGPER